jgi:hypothetical protein
MMFMTSSVIVLAKTGEEAERLLAVIARAVAEYDITLELRAGGVAGSIAGRDRWMARAETAPEQWGEQSAG